MLGVSTPPLSPLVSRNRTGSVPPELARVLPNPPCVINGNYQLPEKNNFIIPQSTIKIKRILSETLYEGIISPTEGKQIVILASLHEYYAPLDEIISSVTNIYSRRTEQKHYLPLVGISVLSDDQTTNKKQIYIINEIPTAGALSTVYELLFEKQFNLATPGKIKIAHQVATALNANPSVGLQLVSLRHVLLDSQLNVYLLNGSNHMDYTVSWQFLYCHSPHYVKAAQNAILETPSAPVLVPQREDFYSYGFFVFELFTQHRAYQSQIHNMTDEKEILNFITQVKHKNESPEYLVNLSAKFSDLCKYIHLCWDTWNKKTPTWDEALTILTSALAVRLFTNQQCLEFWQSNFPTMLSAPLHNVTMAIFEQLGGQDDPTEVTAVQILLTNIAQLPLDCDPKQESIKLREFAAAMEFIGPISTDMIGRISHLVKKQWFHGLLSREESEALLNEAKVGQYLFRFSSSEPGGYSLSMRGSRGCKHFKIQHTIDMGFFINKIEYDSLDEILFRFKKDLHLTTPCPGSPFLPIILAPANPVVPKTSNYSSFWDE